MARCAYCDAEFDDEEGELRHLAAEHDGELSRIDRRRVGELDGDDDGGFPTGPAVLIGVLAISLAIVIYVVVFFDPGGATPGAPGEIGSYGSAHEHGTIEMTVLGESVDFSQSQYQLAADRFHFEGGVGSVWHKHATGVTLGWAMDTLGINVTQNAVTYQGTTYRDSDPAYDVTVTVDGEPVDPETYVLDGVEADSGEGGDHIRIVVSEANGSGS